MQSRHSTCLQPLRQERPSEPFPRPQTVRGTCALFDDELPRVWPPHGQQLLAWQTRPRRSGETKVVSIASCAPCHKVRPSATTSKRLPSKLLNTAKSMSLTWRLVETRAPARHCARCAMMAKHVKLAATSAGAHGQGTRKPGTVGHLNGLPWTLAGRSTVPKPEAHAGNAPMPWHCRPKPATPLHGRTSAPTFWLLAVANRPSEEWVLVHRHGEGGCLPLGHLQTASRMKTSNRITGWARHCANVVLISEHVLTHSHPRLYGCQCSVLSEREQQWHEGIALLPSFTLWKTLSDTHLIFP